MNAACDAATIENNDESVTIDMTGATKTTTTDTVAQEADNGNDNEDVESSDDSDSALMRELLRKAVDDPVQASICDDWLVLPFSGEAVEEAYQASKAPGRALGVVASIACAAVQYFLTARLASASSACCMSGSCHTPCGPR